MLLFLFTLTFAQDMCVYKKIFDDDACTTATSRTETNYAYNKGYSATCVEQKVTANTIFYVSATCTNDDDISVKTCLSTEGCDCTGSPQESTCEAILYGNEGKYEKYVCEPCNELDCHIDDYNGMDLNPECRKSTGEPIEGEFCLQQRFWSDVDCTIAGGDYTDTLYDNTCRTDALGNSWKGKCTMDAEGNIVTATIWEICDSNTCDMGEDHSSCPTAGRDILGETDCQSYSDEYSSYACVPCDEPICGNHPSFMNSVLDNECGNSASSLMMMFATLIAALLF